MYVFEVTFDLPRYENNRESIRELERMKAMGEQYYAESGDVFKFLGVLRAMDIYWNPAEK